MSDLYSRKGCRGCAWCDGCDEGKATPAEILAHPAVVEALAAAERRGREMEREAVTERIVESGVLCWLCEGVVRLKLTPPTPDAGTGDDPC